MITVRVPATSANLGPGFDTLGLALDLFLTVEAIQATTTSCQFYGEGHNQLNSAQDGNMIIAGLNRIFQEAGKKAPPLQLTVNNQIPIGKGLGSSAAAVIAGLFLGNHLLDGQVNMERLIKLAVKQEGHADNAVPAIVGGLTTVMEYEGEIYYQKLNMPEHINIIVTVPDFALPTHKSRQVLPESLSLAQSVASVQKACMLIAGICNRDFRYMDMAMDDQVWQSYRKQFIPGFEQVLSSARKAGAVGVALSGAGPSIIALTEGPPETIGQAMAQTFREHDVSCQVLYLKTNQTGVQIF